MVVRSYWSVLSVRLVIPRFVTGAFWNLAWHVCDFYLPIWRFEFHVSYYTVLSYAVLRPRISTCGNNYCGQYQLCNRHKKFSSELFLISAKHRCSEWDSDIELLSIRLAFWLSILHTLAVHQNAAQDVLSPGLVFRHQRTTQQPPFYGHYTGHPALASTSS